MSGTHFDTNVLLEIATADATWLEWSEGQFRAAAAQGPISINPIIGAQAEVEGLTVATRDATRYPLTIQASHSSLPESPCANPGGRGSVTRHEVSREIAT